MAITNNDIATAARNKTSHAPSGTAPPDIGHTQAAGAKNSKPRLTTRQRWIRRFKKYHKWPGIVVTLFVLLSSLSGIVMNHRDWFSRIDIDRDLLPPGYQYINWNLAAIRGGVKITPTDLVIYGNTGAWLTNDALNSFTSLNTGFGKGIDNRKIESMLYTTGGDLLAGTLFGLYRYNENQWQEVKLPVPNLRITDLMEFESKIYILGRSHLFITDDLKHFEAQRLPEPQGYNHKVSLFKTLWTLHSGELFGHWGKLVVDLMALALIVLSLTGLFHRLAPKWIKRRKRHNKEVGGIVKAMKTNLKWHNKPGYLLLVFLLITTLTGMFLRPPLLIPIASAQIAKIPYTTLDDPNPWFDKLRRITFDREQDQFLLSTSDGFYFFDKRFTTKARPAPIQPPVSVMGCTVLETVHNSPSTFLVGSFTGLFLWQPGQGRVINYLTRQPWHKPERATSPISDHLISGYFATASAGYLLDYRSGMQKLRGKGATPSMPDAMIEASPMSLWNVALEVHTGRIFEHLTGPFYILYVPLLGIVLIVVLISGFFIWWLKRKKKAGQKKKRAIA